MGASAGRSQLRGGYFWLLVLLAACKSADGGAAPLGTPASSAHLSALPKAPRASAAAGGKPVRAVTSASAEAPAEARRAYRIAAVGDSLTDTKSHGGGYLSYIRERCPETSIDNFAEGGHMLNQIRRRFENTVHQRPRGSYTHVIVWGGVNDLYSDLTAGRNPNKAQADLTIIYEKSRQKGAEVVALTVSPWGGFRRYHNARRQAYTMELNAWIRQQLESGTVDHVIDSYALLSCGSAQMLCPDYQQRSKDGLHLGAAGHQVLGEALFEAVFRDCR